ncbi:MAG: transcription termination/antitermination NusG family protein [Ferruginibacter sp.]
MSNSEKRWYALYTKQGAEKKVANLLSRKNIDNYCPLKRQGNAKKKVVLEPLFNSYVFVKISQSEMLAVRQTDCVVNFVYWLGKPAVISGDEIVIMKQFLNEYINVTLEKIPFSQEAKGRVIHGSTTGDYKANMVSVKNNTVNIVLSSLGYIMVAEVEKAGEKVALVPGSQLYKAADDYQFAI